jgi:hypothetical protein
MVAENKKLICGIFILLCLGLVGAISVLPHIEPVQEQPISTQDIIVIDSGFGSTNIIAVDNEYSEIHEILMKNDFNNWKLEEQGVLTQMMQRTAGGIRFDDEFMEYINSMNRSEDIFNTYIDLMGHAGY